MKDCLKSKQILNTTDSGDKMKIFVKNDEIFIETHEIKYKLSPDDAEKLGYALINSKNIVQLSKKQVNKTMFDKNMEGEKLC